MFPEKSINYLHALALRFPIVLFVCLATFREMLPMQPPALPVG